MSSPDWSNGLITGEGDWSHSISKFAGGEGVITLGTLGAGQLGHLGNLRFCSGSSTAFSMRNVRRAWWGGAAPVRPNPIMPRGREFLELSHTYIPERGWGRYVPEFIKNRGWNLNPMWGSQHALVDPGRYAFMNPAWRAANPLPGPLARLWGRMPTSHRITVGAGVCGGAGYGSSVLFGDGTDPEE
jgi:hypothetical protein